MFQGLSCNSGCQSLVNPQIFKGEAQHDYVVKLPKLPKSAGARQENFCPNSHKFEN